MTKRRRAAATSLQGAGAEPVESRLPRVWQDPWALAVAAGVLAVLVAARSAPLGVPVADDFGFLSHALLHAPVDWLDGGGSPLYWRPLSRQLYYLVLGPVMLSWPLVVALVHAALLAGSAVLLYRALRPAWPAPAAALAASFPVLLEAARQIITWPSCAQDLLALVFGTVALHALSRGRRVVALAALLLALLCKEVALAFAPVLALWPAHARPDGSPATRADRVRTLVASLAVVAVWWVVHEWVSRRAGLLPPPRGVEEGPAPGVLETAWFAASGVWLDLWSVRDPAALTATWMPWAVALLLASGPAMALGSAAGRRKLRAALPWVGWGVAWAAIATLPLARFMPMWSSHRSVIPAMGLGLAIAALVRVSPPAWLGALVALRLVALLTSRGSEGPITISGSNVEFDFARVATLQRLAHDVRTTLTRTYPSLPRGALIARNQWPRMSLFAFQESHAFQVWYRDTSLRVLTMADVKSDPMHPPDAIIEFEPHRLPQVTIIQPAALRAVLLASDSLSIGHAQQALDALADLERLQPDTSAAIFLATAWSIRGGALLTLRRDQEAERALRRSVAYFPPDPNAHRFLAEYHRVNGRVAEAVEELRIHLRYFPSDEVVRAKLADLERRAPSAPRPGLR